MSIESGTQHLMSQDFFNVNKSLAKNESTKKIAMYFFISVFYQKRYRLGSVVAAPSY